MHETLAKKSGVRLAAAAALLAGCADGTSQVQGALAGGAGASGKSASYLEPLARGVVLKPLLEVGDSVNDKPGTTTPYRMVGIPRRPGRVRQR